MQFAILDIRVKYSYSTDTIEYRFSTRDSLSALTHWIAKDVMEGMHFLRLRLNERSLHCASTQVEHELNTRDQGRTVS